MKSKIVGAYFVMPLPGRYRLRCAVANMHQDDMEWDERGILMGSLIVILVSSFALNIIGRNTIKKLGTGQRGD